MKHRYLDPTAIANAESIAGNGYEFTPQDDRVNAGKPLPPAVELTPVGPPATVLEFLPEHDRVASRTGGAIAEPAGRKAALVAAVVQKAEEVFAAPARHRSEIEALTREFVEQLARVVAGSAPEPPQK